MISPFQTWTIRSIYQWHSWCHRESRRQRSLKCKSLTRLLTFSLGFLLGKGAVSTEWPSAVARCSYWRNIKWLIFWYYARNGSYVGSFCEGIIKSAQEITASKDGRVMVLDSDQSCHLFNVDGLHLANFSVNIQGDRYYRIACHPVGEHVVVAGEERETHLLIVAIYTVNGDFCTKDSAERNLKA